MSWPAARAAADSSRGLYMNFGICHPWLQHLKRGRDLGRRRSRPPGNAGRQDLCGHLVTDLSNQPIWCRSYARRRHARHGAGPRLLQKGGSASGSDLPAHSLEMVRTLRGPDAEIRLPRRRPIQRDGRAAAFRRKPDVRALPSSGIGTRKLQARSWPAITRLCVDAFRTGANAGGANPWRPGSRLISFYSARPRCRSLTRLIVVERETRSDY